MYTHCSLSPHIRKKDPDLYNRVLTIFIIHSATKKNNVEISKIITDTFPFSFRAGQRAGSDGNTISEEVEKRGACQFVTDERPAIVGSLTEMSRQRPQRQIVAIGK